MVGVAVNVKEPPLQIEVVFDVMLTDGATEVVVIVIGLLVDVIGLAHGSLLVITTVTWSLLFNVVVVNVTPVCPATGLPLIIHW